MGAETMIKYKSFGLRDQTSQNQMESEFMSAPNIPSLTPYAVDTQTYEYNLPIGYNPPIADDWISSLSSAADPYLSWLDDGHQQLEEVREEVEEACTLDSEIVPVPDMAYKETRLLLEFFFHCNVSMPDIGWLMDGGIGFEWRSRDRKGIATMSIYGDNQVVYVASLGGTRRVKGTCELSKFPSLTRFLTMLVTSFSE